MARDPVAAAGDADDEAVVAAQLDRRRRAAAERWDLDDEIVLVAAGEPVPYRAPHRAARSASGRSAH